MQMISYFFCNKIDDIRIKINSSSLASSSNFVKECPSADSQLVSALKTFENISLETLSKIVSSSKLPVLDPFPGKMFKELWPALGPTMLNIVNSSLMTGIGW